MFDNPNAILATGPSGASPTGSMVHAVPAPTSVINPSNPGNTQFISNFAPTAEALLDAMLGETILNDVCPTVPQTTVSCLIDHATVRYDQMHGRYLIGFTVTDTGVQTIGGGIVSARKASWVVIVSRFSQFPTVGQPATSDTFICDSGAANCNRPGPNGARPASLVVLTSELDRLLRRNTGDGFGGQMSTAASTTYLACLTDSEAAPVFDCSVAALNTTTTVCYFPTDLRLGIDNDNITLVSSVLNTNLPVGTNQFAGTRVRVIKKGTGSPGAAARLISEISHRRCVGSWRTVDLLCIGRNNAWRLLRSLCHNGPAGDCSSSGSQLRGTVRLVYRLQWLLRTPMRT